MKRNLLTLSIAVPVALIIGMSCSIEAPAPPPGAGGTGGAAGTGTGGSTTGTGGATTGTGGSDPTGTGGATTGTGGATTGTGGATTGTGGATTGTGGATTGTGGATTGTGGATTGTGGTAGATTGTGGATTGTGGAAGSGGSTAGAGGSAGGGVDAGKAGSGGSAGGSAGAAGAGGGKSDAGIPPGTIVGNFDGYLFTAPCGDGGTGYDCLNAGCSGTPLAKTVVQDFPIAGTPGTIYEVTIRVRGIVEAKNYSGGMRRATGAMDASAQGGDFLYVGGTAPNSSYNTYELHVLNANDMPATGTGAAVDYFLNGRDGSGEAHQSWALNYTVMIPVVGGGKIRFRVFDSNCRQIMNCGPGTGSNMCTAPRNLTLTGSDPPPPASFTQPFVGSAPGGATGQWVFIDVLSVVQR